MKKCESCKYWKRYRSFLKIPRWGVCKAMTKNKLKQVDVTALEEVRTREDFGCRGHNGRTRKENKRSRDINNQHTASVG